MVQRTDQTQHKHNTLLNNTVKRIHGCVVIIVKYNINKDKEQSSRNTFKHRFIIKKYRVII